MIRRHFMIAQSVQDIMALKYQATFIAFLAQPKLPSEPAIGSKTLYDVFNETMRSLQVLGIPKSTWNAIIVHIMSCCSKFIKSDQESRRQWKLSVSRENLPKS